MAQSARVLPAAGPDATRRRGAQLMVHRLYRASSFVWYSILDERE